MCPNPPQFLSIHHITQKVTLPPAPGIVSALITWVLWFHYELFLQARGRALWHSTRHSTGTGIHWFASLVHLAHNSPIFPTRVSQMTLVKIHMHLVCICLRKKFKWLCIFVVCFLFLFLNLLTWEREKHQYVVPLIYAFIGWFLYMPW